MSILAGKVVIVTGASRGIGAAAALALGKAGATVVLAARDGKQVAEVAQQIVQAGGKASASVCDVADYASVERLVAETIERFGRLDVLVNNAGVIEPIAPLAETDPALWAKAIQINLTGAYFAVRAVLPAMIAAGGGTIVNISSGAGTRPLEGWSAYSASKAGMKMLTRSIALEHGPQGVRVFGFSPGTTDTNMQGLIRASGMNQISRIPRENLFPPSLPAKAIVFLCTPAADDLNGQEFSIRDEGFLARVDAVLA